MQIVRVCSQKIRGLREGVRPDLVRQEVMIAWGRWPRRRETPLFSSPFAGTPLTRIPAESAATTFCNDRVAHVLAFFRELPCHSLPALGPNLAHEWMIIDEVTALLLNRVPGPRPGARMS